MSFATKAAILSAFAASTLAHGTVQSFLTDGTFNQGFKLEYFYTLQNGQAPPTHYGWYAENLDNGFVEPASYGSKDIICHKNAKPASATAKVAAGGKVDFQWTEWPESHIGPVITYMANCNGDCADVDPSALKFFKIDEAGYDVSTKSWAAVDMIANNNTWSTTVPSNIAAGNYVFRHEIIALHAANNENGAQNYPQCVNIEVTGSGTENPEGVLATELYSPKDAGILFNPYTNIQSYEIPGPALVGGGSPSNPPPSKPVSSSTPTPTASAVATSSAAPAKPSATASPSSAPAPAPTQGNNNGGDSALPQTFTLDTFIAWLQKTAGKASSKRRHARDF